MNVADAREEVVDDLVVQAAGEVGPEFAPVREICRGGELRFRPGFVRANHASFFVYFEKLHVWSDVSDLEHEREEPAGCEFSQRPQREEFRIRVVVRGVFERQIEVVKRPDGFRTPKLEKFPSLKFRHRDPTNFVILSRGEIVEKARFKRQQTI